MPLYPETPKLSTFPQKLSGSVKRFVVEGHASKQEAVLISHRAHRYLPFAVIDASANGMHVEPSYSDPLTYVYRLPAGVWGNDVAWKIEIDGAPEYVDVLTLGAR